MCGRAVPATPQVAPPEADTAAPGAPACETVRAHGGARRRPSPFTRGHADPPCSANDHAAPERGASPWGLRGPVNTPMSYGEDCW